MASFTFFLCTLLTFSLSFHGISSVKYEVILETPLNHKGMIKFNTVIGGIPYTKQIMGQINNFIWSTVFNQNMPAERKPVDTLQVFMKDNTGTAIGVTWGVNKINISMSFLAEYPGPMELKWVFTALMHHEMGHVFQWFGGNKAPPGLVEGIAEYVVLKAKYNSPIFQKPGSGDKWDKGYDFTARFLEYCDGLVPGFVARLNNMMRYNWDVSFFKNITGKPVEQLWKEYKANYPGVK